MYQNNGLETDKTSNQLDSPNPLWKEWQKACQLEERIRAARYRRNKIVFIARKCYIFEIGKSNRRKKEIFN